MKRQYKILLFSFLVLLVIGFIGGLAHLYHPVYGRKVVTQLNSELSVEGLLQLGEQLYQQNSCVDCHGVGGKYPSTDYNPKLDGQREAYLYQQMLDIKHEQRTNSQSVIMKAIFESMSEQELRAVSKYLSAQ